MPLSKIATTEDATQTSCSPTLHEATYHLLSPEHPTSGLKDAPGQASDAKAVLTSNSAHASCTLSLSELNKMHFCDEALELASGKSKHESVIR